MSSVKMHKYITFIHGFLPSSPGRKTKPAFIISVVSSNTLANNSQKANLLKAQIYLVHNFTVLINILFPSYGIPFKVGFIVEMSTNILPSYLEVWLYFVVFERVSQSHITKWLKFCHVYNEAFFLQIGRTKQHHKQKLG